MLITTDEAEQIVLESVSPLPAEDCPLAQAHGRVLRTPLKADRNLPPFDRVTMDGYALRTTDLADGRRTFRVTGTQAAGMIPLSIKNTGDCVEIMTGASLPCGADCVVPYENVSREDIVITLAATARLTPGANLHRHGSDAAAGTLLVHAGARLTGREIAVAASVGAAVVNVAMRPSVAVLATGDELVEVDYAALAPHQIRRSNDYALRAAILSSNLVSRAERFHLRDLPHEIDTTLQRVIASFALPGNPVSAYTCLHRYVFPALAHMAGATPIPLDYVSLDDAVNFPQPLAYLLPVTLTTSPDGRRTATPSPSGTSGDFSGLIGTDGFVELPPGSATFPTGTAAKFWRWS